jgi:arylsulfatase A-like enzyme
VQTRREFLSRGLGCGMTMLASPGLLSASAPVRRPSFVWLVSEDNSKHFLRLFDDQGVSTPHIEKLAQQGVAFTRAFSNCPVCSAARSVLATGCYGSRIGTQFHRKHMQVPLPGGLRPFQVYLQGNGYYTSNKKKTDYNFSTQGKVWDSAEDWRGCRPGQPFFHMQSFGTTHESSLHVAIAKEPTEEGAKAALPPIHPDTPLFRNTYAHYYSRIRKVDQEIGKVVDALEKDDLLEDTFVFYFGDHGGVLPGSKGYAYETGLHVPLVVRIPENWKHLVDLKRGTRMRGFVSFVDFGPTVLHLAGLKVPKAMDGRAFMGPGITRSDLSQRDETFGMADRFDEKYDLVRTLRKGKFKYMRNYQPFNIDGLQNNYRYKMAAYTEWRELYHAGRLNPVQSQFFRARAPEALYDVEADPYETDNLAQDPAYAQALSELRQRLTARVKGLPDLSLFPESYLAQEAFGNPVIFGQAHQAEIGRLVDIADLSLVSFEQAKSGVRAALTSGSPWERYWGLIVCSTHGPAALSFVERAKAMAQRDPELLVRVRAAEFLALVGVADPRPVIMAVLAQAEHPLEALLTLNTVVLLRDCKPGYAFAISAKDVKAQHANISRRLEYLAVGNSSH